MNITEKLLNMKDKIESAKNNILRLEGSRDQLYKALQTDHGCKTVEEAEDKLSKMTKELDQKEVSLKEGIEKLERDYDWN